MNGFEIGEFIIIGVDADAEKQPCISSVNDFVVPELVCGLASQHERSFGGGTLRQNSTDTSGLEGQLSGVLPHATGPMERDKELRWPGSCLETAPHFFIVVVRHVPFRQSCLTLAVLEVISSEENKGVGKRCLLARG